MIVIDIETTGVDPRVHAVVSVGAIEFENPDNTFYSESRIWDGAKIDPQSLLVNGFSEAEVTDPHKQSQYILIKSFVEWVETIKDHTPAGLHIGNFDLAFLQMAADRENINWPLGKRSIDLHALVYAHVLRHNPDRYETKNSRSNIHSHFIQKYCGLDFVPRPHNALTDAKWEAECFCRLIRGQNLLPEYESVPIPSYLLRE